MKKFILLLLLILSFVLSYSFNVSYKKEVVQYWGENKLQITDNLLVKWNKKILQKQDPIKIYDSVLKKIDKLLNKKISENIKYLLFYVKEVILLFNENYVKTIQSQPLNLSGQTEEGINNLIKNYNLDYSTLKRNDILVPISGTLYGVLGFYVKSLYGNSLAYSFVFQNIYGGEADYNIKNLYLVSSTGLILSKSKLVNGVVYFNLNKATKLLRGWNTTFYILAELNPIISLNQTNKRLKLKLIKSYGTYKTKIISKENGNEAYWVNSEFNANNYIFRKSKPILENKYLYGRLHKGENKIYSLYIDTTGDRISLKKIILDINASNNVLIDTGSVEIYLNNIIKKNIKTYLDGQRGNIKLYIDFDNYDILKKTKIDIYVNVLRTRDNNSIYTRLNQVSSNNSIVNGNYTGDYSLLYSDKAYRGLLDNSVKDYFTESYLDFSKVAGWYLKDK